ncbi:hypothetical protein FPQ18DRAFT_87907 [Pyronema domesticum]|nr:hypothetical protein FPQ18DRAFT_87907 [Pyronema domesticum]
MGLAYSMVTKLTSGSSDLERHYYTFRIQSIDESISKEQLTAWLTQLSPSTGRIMALSLAPHNGHKTATATFKHVPPEFESMSSGKNSGDLMVKIGGMEIEVTIDGHFLGITPLCSVTDPSIDIVAGPGLGSHAFCTWKSQNGFKMWLRDFLPKDKDLQNTRILLFGYRSDLKDNSSRDSIQEYAQRFLIQLQHCQSEQRRDTDRHMPRFWRPFGQEGTC